MALRVLLLIVIAAAASAASAEAKQPTDKWVVNFADAQCLATRNYGSEHDPFFLVLKAPPLGDVIQIGLVWEGGAREATQVDGDIIFDEAPPIRTNLLQYGVQSKRQQALYANVPTAKLAPMRTATSIRIRSSDEGFKRLGSRIGQGGSHTDVQLQLTQMPALLQVMESCVADLRDVWNVGASADAGTLKRDASADLANLFSGDDYPWQSLLDGQGGAVRVALLVDEKGQVADCSIIETSHVAALDAQSCALLKDRAKFEPALGTDGKPAKGAFIQTVKWMVQP